MKIKDITIGTSLTIPIQDKYYKYECRVTGELEKDETIEDAKKRLWNFVIAEVDNQVQDVINSYKS